MNFNAAKGFEKYCGVLKGGLSKIAFYRKYYAQYGKSCPIA